MKHEDVDAWAAEIYDRIYACGLTAVTVGRYLGRESTCRSALGRKCASPPQRSKERRTYYLGHIEALLDLIPEGGRRQKSRYARCECGSRAHLIYEHATLCISCAIRMGGHEPPPVPIPQAPEPEYKPSPSHPSRTRRRAEDAAIIEAWSVAMEKHQYSHAEYWEQLADKRRLDLPGPRSHEVKRRRMLTPEVTAR